jgi:hypothetical protein
VFGDVVEEEGRERVLPAHHALQVHEEIETLFVPTEEERRRRRRRGDRGDRGGRGGRGGTGEGLSMP